MCTAVSSSGTTAPPLPLAHWLVVPRRVLVARRRRAPAVGVLHHCIGGARPTAQSGSWRRFSLAYFVMHTTDREGTILCATACAATLAARARAAVCRRAR